jgi:acetyltransferase-like isoleucine patch superfamily enzyme
MYKQINKLLYYLFSYPVYRLLLLKIGSGSRLVRPKIDGHRFISIGDKVFLEQSTWLAAAPIDGSNQCLLSIGDGTYIGRYGHIYATKKIIIGKKVLIADKVYISDNQHNYQNVALPVIDQQVLQLPAVEIGDGAWLGENACIIGATIGKNSVVAANAIVRKNIPDYCVAVGAPAKIVKRYNFELNEWCKTDREGNFI